MTSGRSRRSCTVGEDARSVADSFAIGFKELGPEERLLDFDATFKSRRAAPAPVATTWRDGAVSIERRLLAKGKDPDEDPWQDPPQEYVFKSPEGSWRYGIENIWQTPMYTGFFTLLRIAATGDDPSRHMTEWDRVEETGDRQGVQTRYVEPHRLPQAAAGDGREAAGPERPRCILDLGGSAHARSAAGAAVRECSDAPAPS